MAFTDLLAHTHSSVKFLLNNTSSALEEFRLILLKWFQLNEPLFNISYKNIFSHREIIVKIYHRILVW